MLFQKGQTIDNRYTVVFPHKEGSYAETYRVRDINNGKLRFLKLIYYSKLQYSQFDKKWPKQRVDTLLAWAKQYKMTLIYR